MLIIDGKEYDAEMLFIPESGIERQFNVLDGENTTILQENGRMYREIIGTFYTYIVKIDTNRLNPQEYDELYETVCAPVESHQLTLPYGQTTLSFEAYITSGKDKLLYQINGVNYWGELSLEFVSMEAIRV